jgi:predicted RNA methylase
VSKSKELDQFYTNQTIAKKLYSQLESKFDLSDYYLLEPSAGSGSFSDLFHQNSLACDLDPKKEYIQKQDFFDIDNEIFNDKKVFTIGNPPFGKNSSLAIKFVNKAAEFSDYIAFILPKTFKKISVHNKISLNMHLLYEEELPLNSFIFNGQEYSVPCVFQIWEKRNIPRVKIETKKETALLDFTNKSSADFAIRRVGVLAGKVLSDFSSYQESSHYFIKSTKIPAADLIKIIGGLYGELNTEASNTVGNPSLSKHEFIQIIEKYIHIEKAA